MLSGLPASGKSTVAEELVRTMGNAVRVNRDLLRTMLHFDKWTGRNEGITIDAEKAIARDALTRGLNVIVDDTNLSDRHRVMWRTIAEECNATFETHLVNTHWLECVKRDDSRNVCVGGNTIVNMALQYGLYEKPSNGFLICDLDGTLCDISHRLHFVKVPEGQKKDWKSFFAGIPDDTLRTDVFSMVHELHDKNATPVVFVSARPEDHREATEEWLHKHWGKAYVSLIMRKKGDKRPDTEVKQQIYDTYFNNKYDIHTVIDDRPSVIRMWRENGLNVVDVGSGVEF